MDFEGNPVTFSFFFFTRSINASNSREGHSKQRGRVEYRNKASLDIVCWEERALVVSLILVAGGEEYDSLRVALETLN